MTRQGVVKAARHGAGLLILLLGWAMVLHPVVYLPVFGHLSLEGFPGTLIYCLRSGTSDSQTHPLQAAASRESGGLSVAIPQNGMPPLRQALSCLGRSGIAMSTALVLLLFATFARFLALVLLPATGRRRLPILIAGRVVESVVRLPGLLVLFVLLAIRTAAGHPSPPSSDFHLVLVLAAVLAFSDGIVPDLSDILHDQYRNLARKDYTKIGLLQGRPLPSLVRRELALSLADAVGSRLPQLIGGAFILEVILRYSGLGWTLIEVFFAPAPPGGGLRVWYCDRAYALLLVTLALSALVLEARGLAVRFLDPRPRAAVVR